MTAGESADHHKITRAELFKASIVKRAHRPDLKTTSTRAFNYFEPLPTEGDAALVDDLENAPSFGKAVVD